MSEMMMVLVLVLPIVPVVLGVGIFVVVYLQRSKAAKQLAVGNGDSFVVVTNIHAGQKEGQEYAENVYIKSVDGQPAQRARHSIGVVGYYLQPGEYELVVDADYGEYKQLIRHTDMVIQVTIEKGNNYSLNYHVPSKQLEFRVYENSRVFKEEKDGVFL